METREKSSGIGISPMEVKEWVVSREFFIMHREILGPIEMSGWREEALGSLVT